MKFCLIDRIVELTPGERIVTTKSVSLAEEYLADHFPTFPVLPGVLMLEALTQSAAWLVRATQDFQNSLILLNEARNVTYKSFVKPGQTLRMEVNCRQISDGGSEFQGIGVSGDVDVVKARFSLRHQSLVVRGAEFAEVDRRITQLLRDNFELLRSN